MKVVGHDDERVHCPGATDGVSTEVLHEPIAADGIAHDVLTCIAAVTTC
jgi:hypothetical protein